MSDFHANARGILLDCLHATQDPEFRPKSDLAKEVARVILGSHLTYRYVLITGLLAKSADEKLNPLVLQSGSSLQGAYDARSLCHKVVVPFEREFLDSKLGGSNEPYLNKPARFKELSLTNAVRKGNDTVVLQTAIRVLTAATSQVKAVELLKESLYYVLQRSGSTEPIGETILAADAQDAWRFAQSLLSKTCHGESSVLATAGALSLIAPTLSGQTRIITHPTNESGASSKEAGDIDVIRKGTVWLACEVKDKPCSHDDVVHEMRKAVAHSVKKLLFVMGPQGSLQGSDDLGDIWAEAERLGCSLMFTSVERLTRLALGFSDDANLGSYFDAIRAAARDARIKDATRSHLMACLEQTNTPGSAS